MKKIIKLTEDDLTRIVKRVISEQMVNPSESKREMRDSNRRLVNTKYKDGREKK